MRACTYDGIEYNYGNDHNAYPAYLMRSLTHVSQMALAGLHSLVWWFAPIAQLVVFLTVTPRFGLQGAWENVSINHSSENKGKLFTDTSTALGCWAGGRLSVGFSDIGPAKVPEMARRRGCSLWDGIPCLSPGLDPYKPVSPKYGVLLPGRYGARIRDRGPVRNRTHVRP